MIAASTPYDPGRAQGWRGAGVAGGVRWDGWMSVSPLVLGAGTRLFPDGAAPVNLALTSAQTAGPAVRLIYTRPDGQDRTEVSG